MNKLAIFALLLVAASVNADSAEEKVQGTMKECAEKHGLTMEQVKEGAEDSDKEKELSCFHACVMQGLGVMDGAEVNVDALKELIVVLAEKKDLDKETADAAVDSCAEEGLVPEPLSLKEILSGTRPKNTNTKDLTDPCEVSLAYGKCLKTKLK